MWLIKVCFLLIFLLVVCQALHSKWWQTASFYQIYPRSFKDSDGDGVGDLKGIKENLAYLKEIGITATWLSPIFTSPMADFGYDVANLTEIDPIFGTMFDFEALVEVAKKIGIKLILDFVPNHTSDECEWFKKSAANDSYYRDFYVWHPGKIVGGIRKPPTNWMSAFRGSMWTWHEQRQAYYLHQFLAKQPDLNYRNPNVVDTMKNVLRFWLRKGASGFRVDAVPHTYEIAADSEGNYPDEPRNTFNSDPESHDYYQHIYTKDQPETLDLIYQFRQVLDDIKEELHQNDDFILMVEAFTSLDIIMQYYGNSTHEGAQIPFNFQLIDHLNNQSNAYHYEKIIYSWLNIMPQNRTANWVIGNHDQPRIDSRLGKDKIDIINMLILSLPGCSVTYQGEEIGMTNVWISWNDTIDPRACQSNPEIYERLSRDPSRTPFQWSDKPFAGFTTGPSTWLNVSVNYKTINVKRERGIALSHLNVYKKIQNLRKEPTFQEGGASVIAINENVLVIKRYLKGAPSYIVLLNMGDDVETLNLSKTIENLKSKLKYVVVTSASVRREGDTISPISVTLMPKEAVILKTVEN